MIKHGDPPFLECSSKGDKRFSAFYAKIKGKSIEELYQAFKVFEDGSTGLYWKDAKGRKAVNMDEAAKYYSSLWDEYIRNNPKLLSILKSHYGLSDMFGQVGHLCQATELWRIRNKSMLEIFEHKSASYAPRTYHNASVADVTIAIAADHNTGGEKCTHKAVLAAKQEILKLDLSTMYIPMAREIFKRVKNIDDVVINIAGNGMSTLSKHNWNQEQVNRIIYDTLTLVHQHHPIGKIVSGGQTGVDLAGGVAAYKLGIPCTLTLPKGFLMRIHNGKDYEHTEEFVRNLVVEYADKL